MSAIENLRKEVTCNVCLEQFTDPKQLPCRHIFCLSCIMQMTESRPFHRRSNHVACPTCRRESPLPPGGANDLQVPLHIDSIIHALDNLQQSVENRHPQPALPPVPQGICTQHNDRLTVHCETCSTVICRDCTISEHRMHTYSLICDCYPEHHQQMLNKLDQVKQKVIDTDTLVTHFDIRESEVHQQGESVKQQIIQHTQKLIDDMQQSQTRLIQEVDTVMQHNLQGILSQKHLAEDILGELKTCVKEIEHTLEDLPKEEILAQKQTMMDSMTTAIQITLIEDSVEDVCLNFEKRQISATNIGKIIHSRLAIENTNVKVTPSKVRQPSIATLTLQSNDGSPYKLHHSLISSTLSSPEQSVKCSVTPTHALGKYKIDYKPFTRKDRLHIRVAGISLNPVAIPVLPTPEARGQPINVISELSKPHGVAVFENGDIVVAENSAHCLMLFNKAGEKKKTIGMHGTKDGQFVFPNRVAISSDNHILATDDHRLQKFNADGTFIKAIYGSESSGGQFRYPEGIAVQRKTDQIFVADSCNNRIQVFTNDLEFVRTIKPKGFSILQLERRLKNPHDIAIDDNGFLYIADWEKNCVRKLNDQGKLIHTVGSRGSARDDHLSAPSSLVVHNDVVYVSEWGNHRVSVFKTSGEFVCCFSGYGKEGNKLCEPRGIAIDASGDLYVCDSKNSRIVIF